MKKYIILKEWLGSKPVGTIIELDKIHSSLEANVREVCEVEETNDADLKKENTNLKSKATKAENQLKEAEDKLQEALDKVDQQEMQITSLQAIIDSVGAEKQEDNKKEGK